MNSHILYVIGDNWNCQLGLDATTTGKSLNKLTNWNETNKNILVTNIHCTYGATIFRDNKQQFWGCGNSAHSECGTGSSDSELELTKITFWKQHDINIIKVCTNVGGRSTFWISDNYKLYGNGFNAYGQLGLHDQTNRQIPTLIDDIDNVIHVAGGIHHSIALCKPISDENLLIIIKYLYRDCGNDKVEIPSDIINIIKLFSNFTKVYSAGTDAIGQEKDIDCKIFTEIMTFEEKLVNITKVGCGWDHTLFLDSDGNIWCCGKNRDEQLGIKGLETHFNQYIPIRIPYFYDNDIKIKDFDCGLYHCLAIDYDGCVYGWGSNDRAQCGVDVDTQQIEPKLIESLRNYNIIEVKCGGSHSYAKSEKGMHFLFGGNTGSEWSLSANSEILEPVCINQVFEEITNGKMIKDVYLGNGNTFIVGCNDNSLQ